MLTPHVTSKHLDNKQLSVSISKWDKYSNAKKWINSISSLPSLPPVTMAIQKHSKHTQFYLPSMFPHNNNNNQPNSKLIKNGRDELQNQTGRKVKCLDMFQLRVSQWPGFDISSASKKHTSPFIPLYVKIIDCTVAKYRGQAIIYNNLLGFSKALSLDFKIS